MDSFKRGTGIIMSPKLSSAIQQHGVIEKGRVQFVTFKISMGITLGIINIYAHNYTGSRANMDETTWMYGNCILRTLPWDPAEWKWKTQGMIPQCKFFSCTTKSGYKIGLTKIPAKIQALQLLQLYGFTKKQTSQLLNRIWHPWTPRKISSMNRLTILGGFLVGEWRKKAGWEGHYRLCQNSPLEHGLMRCNKVKEAWAQYRALRVSAGLTDDSIAWRMIIMGPLHNPRTNTIQEGVP